MYNEGASLFFHRIVCAPDNWKDYLNGIIMNVNPLKRNTVQLTSKIIWH